MAEGPRVVAETASYAAIYKPPLMHSAPLKKKNGPPSLLEWYADIFPLVMDLKGRKEGEGGLVHRLDYETSGLILAAKTQAALDIFEKAQREGSFVKEYLAFTGDTGKRLPGFPPSPAWPEPEAVPFFIESYFRPWGPGRKAARPLLEMKKGAASDQGRPYATEILRRERLGTRRFRFYLRLRRGFRHQIRCHLAWIGFPVLNDPLYGAETPAAPLALRAEKLHFDDPETGSRLSVSIDALSLRLGDFIP